ncbi:MULTISPECIES: aldo/keto reductase [Lactobacillus]|uniref:Aldo/keto reductase n=1 Tax=Lactobacillus xujianguonis TaxID=2495899 RepID=A0A437SSP2_9LACO|nr:MULTISPECIES: aldo/keto reductase [Lactobacillus]RVU69966.1 aldo/keto reductase [Lactobacillus xujianguonis]RVU72372.1 aldo/keto reductase [Lactobacillus xujianguonis]
MQYFTLNDGHRIPALGFGTYRLNGSAGATAVEEALQNGYRLVDSAAMYDNEGAVGYAIRHSSVPRDQIFVTSKLMGKNHSYELAIKQIQESLFRMGLDYLDLFLIHWPNPKKDDYVEAWQALIDAQKFGLVRSIGVSNFEPEHLTKVIKETGVTPAVNQVELHPYWSSKETREFDQKHGIITEAWSPLQRGGEAFKEQLVKDLAEKYHKTPAQIILRWEHQLDIVPIPKASSYAHQSSNLDIFDFTLTDPEVAAITALDRADGRRLDPAEVEG